MPVPCAAVDLSLGVMEGASVRTGFGSCFGNWVLAFEAPVQKDEAPGRHVCCIGTLHPPVRFGLCGAGRVGSRAGRSVQLGGLRPFNREDPTRARDLGTRMAVLNLLKFSLLLLPFC